MPGRRRLLFPLLHWALSLACTFCPRTALSQSSEAKCVSGWDWADSKSGDSPCDVAAQLMSLCEGNDFSLPAGGFYSPSSSESATIKANVCSCNVVVYKLLMLGPRLFGPALLLAEDVLHLLTVATWLFTFAARPALGVISVSSKSSDADETRIEGVVDCMVSREMLTGRSAWTEPVATESATERIETAREGGW